MKKAYESPKAEQMVFDYSETVVASGFQTCSGADVHYYDQTPTPGYTTCREKNYTTGENYTENL